jgi:2'-5' RNA ligase
VAFEVQQTAVIVPVPQAEAAVRSWRERLDPAAAVGVPAHVTVVYPFLPEARVDEDVVADLRRLVAAEPAFPVTLAGFDRFPGVLYLAPQPAEPFRRLTAATVRRWPEAPPYGGAFGADVIPHLTISDRATPERQAAAERDVAGHLPITGVVDEAWLIRFDGVRWSRWAVLPLGPARS